VTPQLAAWFARQHRRACALDALSDMGVDPNRLRFVRHLVERGAYTDWPPSRELPT
jgi:hypothetical protein